MGIRKTVRVVCFPISVLHDLSEELERSLNTVSLHTHKEGLP